MDSAERETLIIINKADMLDGFYIIFTTEKKIYEKVCTRIGGPEKLISLEIGYELNGKPRSWCLKVPAQYWSNSSVGIRKKRKKRAKPEMLEPAAV